MIRLSTGNYMAISKNWSCQKGTWKISNHGPDSLLSSIRIKLKKLFAVRSSLKPLIP